MRAMAGPDGEELRGGVFEQLETVRQRGFGDWLRPPLHERIEAYIDEIDPRRRGCSGDLGGRTPGDARRVSPSSVRMKWLYEDDGHAAPPDDHLDAVRYTTFGPEVTLTRETREDGRPVGYDRMVSRLKREREMDDVLPVTYLDTEAQDELAERLPRYCPSCGADRVRVSITFEAGEPVKTELQCSECEPGPAGQA